jgi:hypothetical protein
MPRIICVEGVSNSGKSSSIRKFLELRGIRFPASPRDIRVIFTAEIEGRKLTIGVASAGDTAAAIKKNFEFFAKHPCDVIACASKSQGQSVAAVTHWAKKLGATVERIVTSARTMPREQEQDHIRVAGEIERLVLG